MHTRVVSAACPGTRSRRLRAGSIKAFLIALFFFQILLVSFRGPVKQIDKDQLRIETDEHETLTFRRTHKTKFLKDGKKVDPSTVTVGTHVIVDTEKDPDGGLVAVNVLVGK